MARKSSAADSMKRIGVNKANARIVAVTAGATFVVMFCLVGAYSLFGQLTYQNRVISAKNKAIDQLEANLKARDSLVTSYTAFAKSGQNFIGGASGGSGPQDGANPKLVLDALPGKYDYPALTSSLEKIAQDQHVTIEAVTGTDDEIAQSDKQDEASPKPIEMPFGFSVSGEYMSVRRTVDAFDKSIRPVVIQKMILTGDASKVNLELTAASYYQPSKALNIKTKVVK